MLHSCQPVGGRPHTLRVKAVAVVTDVYFDLARVVAHPNVHLLGLCIFPDVGERLLNQPVHGELARVVQFHRFEMGRDFQP